MRPGTIKKIASAKQWRTERAAQKRKLKVVTDEIIESYMSTVNRERLRHNLKLTPTQRLEQLMTMQRFVDEHQEAGSRLTVREMEELWWEARSTAL
jgi:hypothetical protein